MSQQSSQSLEQRLYGRLMTEFQPEKLNVINESHLHAGHAGDDGSGESHFKIEISIEKFKNMAYVQRERAVHQAISEEMQQIHALSVKFIQL